MSCSKDTAINTVFPSLFIYLAEALVKDEDAGTFVVRDSTTYRGSFGLAMKVDQSPTSLSPSAYPGKLLLELYALMKQRRSVVSNRRKYLQTVLLSSSVYTRGLEGTENHLHNVNEFV